MDTNEPSARLTAASPRWSTLRPRRGQPWLDWCKGPGFLVLHIDLFLVAIAALLLLNITRSPDHIWVGGVFWRWGLLLVIHAMATLLIWLIGLLLSEERPGAGTYEAEWSAMPRDGHRPPLIVEPVDVVPETTPWTSVAGPGNGMAAQDDGWRAGDATAPNGDWHAGFEQRTSWSETSASAWLARRRSEPAAEAPAEPPPETHGT